MVVLHCAAMLRFSVATVYDCRAQDCFFLRFTAGRIAYWWFAFSAFCLLSVRLQAILHVAIILSLSGCGMGGAGWLVGEWLSLTVRVPDQ